MYDLDHGGRQALVHLSLMLVVSLAINIIAATKAPLPGDKISTKIQVKRIASPGQDGGEAVLYPLIS
jgi:hypothetical protein